MLKLITLISSIIEPIVPCYADHYPEEEEKVYPYADFKFDVTPNNTFSDNNILAINVWHNLGTDIRAIEGIADSINAALNRLKHNDTNFFVSIYKNTPCRLSLPDPEIGIQRRELRYVVKTHRK